MREDEYQSIVGIEKSHGAEWGEQRMMADIARQLTRIAEALEKPRTDYVNALKIISGGIEAKRLYLVEAFNAGKFEGVIADMNDAAMDKLIARLALEASDGKV